MDRWTDGWIEVDEYHRYGRMDGRMDGRGRGDVGTWRRHAIMVQLHPQTWMLPHTECQPYECPQHRRGKGRESLASKSFGRSLYLSQAEEFMDCK